MFLNIVVVAKHLPQKKLFGANPVSLEFALNCDCVGLTSIAKVQDLQTMDKNGEFCLVVSGTCDSDG